MCYFTVQRFLIICYSKNNANIQLYIFFHKYKWTKIIFSILHIEILNYLLIEKLNRNTHTALIIWKHYKTHVFCFEIFIAKQSAVFPNALATLHTNGWLEKCIPFRFGTFFEYLYNINATYRYNFFSYINSTIFSMNYQKIFITTHINYTYC